MELLNTTKMVAGYTQGLEPDGKERIVVVPEFCTKLYNVNTFFNIFISLVTERPLKTEILDNTHSITLRP